MTKLGRQRNSGQKRKLRDRLRRRRGNRCALCGCSGPLTLDHRIPLSRGGTWKIGNLQLLCATCNREKGDSLPWEASA